MQKKQNNITILLDYSTESNSEESFQNMDFMAVSFANKNLSHEVTARTECVYCVTGKKFLN